MIVHLAAFDWSPIALIIAAVLGGGGIAALRAWKTAKPEMESISVTTMRGVIDELRHELERKDRQIAEQNRLIGDLRSRVEKLEKLNGYH